MKNNFKNKVILITGTSSGFGLSLAKKYISYGAKVYGISRKEFSLEGLTHYACDISNVELVKQTVNKILKQEHRIDILINNAGMGVAGPVEDTTPEFAEKIMGVNFLGAFYVTKYVLPSMREHHYGKIINVSSFAALVALPYQAFYSASKSAMNSLFDGMRAEVHDFKIKITNVMPGDAKTNFTANRVKMNVSENSAYINHSIKAIKTMEHDEQTGLNPDKIVNAIIKISKKKNPPHDYVVGFKYKAFHILVKILPKKIREFILRKMYG